MSLNSCILTTFRFSSAKIPFQRKRFARLPYPTDRDTHLVKFLVSMLSNPCQTNKLFKIINILCTFFDLVALFYYSPGLYRHRNWTVW